MTASDSDLVLRSRSGDRVAFTALVGRYRDRFLRYARHMLADQEDAEEVVQDTLVRAYRALDRCEPQRGPVLQSSCRPDVLDARTSGAVAHGKRYRLSVMKLVERGVCAGRLTKEILVAVACDNESKAFVSDEPLDGAADCGHVYSLNNHRSS